MKRILVVVMAVFSLLLAAGAASAEPVQQFSFQLTKIKSDGRFTLIFLARTYDTTGGVPPELLSNYLRIPAGAKLRPEFLNKRWFCDGPALRDALNRDLEDSDKPFADRVANLKPFIAKLRKSTSKRDKRALANALTCDRARIGSGTAQIDARASIAALTDLIPSKFSLFFSKPTVPGALAGFTVVGAADANAAIVKRYPIVEAVHVALTANFFDEPTPDGLYGYRLQLPSSNVNGFKVSIAELRVVNTGLTILKGTCLKKNKNGRCTKKQKKTIFWFTQPDCPPSGRISFLSFFEYADPQPDITKTLTLACPNFG
ncbi:MAG: hypothetical protein WBC33_06295 [Conexibacter sp.]